MQKLAKTRVELEAILIAEIRRYPECDKVEAVAITSPGGRNWDMVVLRDGPHISTVCRNQVRMISNLLLGQYDLADDAK
jgi:hypothetical protein